MTRGEMYMTAAAHLLSRMASHCAPEHAPPTGLTVAAAVPPPSGPLPPAGYAQPSAGISPEKARKILHDGSVQGHPLTDAQRRMFGAAAGRSDHAGDERPRYYADPRLRPPVPFSYPRDRYGRIRGVMQQIPNADFMGGRFGYRRRGE